VIGGKVTQKGHWINLYKFSEKSKLAIFGKLLLLIKQEMIKPVELLSGTMYALLSLKRKDA
jgi:hypothetical protein